LKTADAVTPGLTANTTVASLIFFVAIYATIFSFGTIYIYRLLRAGPARFDRTAAGGSASRPLALAGGLPAATIETVGGR
jgi:cytochrome d ubiquinol oxidase subunit I